MLRTIGLSFLLLFLTNSVCSSQVENAWSLDDCIDYALSHNVNMKRQELTNDVALLDVEEAKWSFAPSFSASSNYTMSVGRVLDPTTYDFIKTNYTGNSSTSISGNVILYNGGRRNAILERARLNLRAMLLEDEVLKNNIKINVTASYLDVLCTAEQVRISKEIVLKIQSQLDRINLLLDAGVVTESDVLQLKSQLFSAINDTIATTNLYNLAKLSLCDLLEIDEYKTFSVITPDEDLSLPQILNVETIIDVMPEYQSGQMSLEVKKKDIKIAKSSLLPSVSLAAGLGTNYSDARKKVIINTDGTLDYESYSFFQQYADNANAYASININIPVLSGLSAKRNVKRAKMNVENEEYSLGLERRVLRKRLIQAQLDCESAYQAYNSAVEQLRYAENVEQQMSDKYNLGAVDFNTWNIAVVELASAGYNMAKAKYTCMMKKKILLIYAE